MMTALPTEGSGPSTEEWSPWRVAPGFEVCDRTGEVDVVQCDATNFLVKTPFRYNDETVLAELRAQLGRRGIDPPGGVARAVEDARTFSPSENPTDLASIPPFARWFVNTYGLHTLAAILHDNLICPTPNAGALGSDTLSDRFFRQMLGSVGVPFLKRWVVWSAVALRSRFVAGGLRRASVCLWGVLAAGGIAGFFRACVQWAGLAEPLRLGGQTLGHGVLFAVAGGLPVVSGVLWGKQFAASVVAAVAAVLMLPAALFALAGSLVYALLEHLLGALGRVLGGVTALPGLVRPGPRGGGRRARA